MPSGASVAHSFLAIVAGFIVTLGLTGIATALLKWLAPSLVRDDRSPDLLAMTVNLALAIIFSIVGGYVTARVAERNPLVHDLMLALVVLLLSALSSMQMRGQKPVYYLLIMTALPSAAVLLGGLARMYQLGMHW